MKKGYEVKEILEKESGKIHRIYSYNGKPCRRIPLDSKIAAQVAGYTLIEKDLRSVATWLHEIDRLVADRKLEFSQGGNFKSGDREVFNVVKGLFVAALIFYGKAFSKCEGRPVKLERVQIKEMLRELHDQCIAFRHNFAAHSGAKKIEHVTVAVVLPRAGKGVAPDLYTELAQPDFFLAIHGDLNFHNLVEDARQVAIKKKHLLMEKIMKEEVLPKGEKYWLTC